MSYRTPAGPAPIGEMTHPAIAEALRVEPESPMPAVVAYARVQARSYWSRSIQGVEIGGLSLVAASDLERGEDADSIGRWPNTSGVVRLSSILVPRPGRDDVTDSVMALRRGAASLRADVLVLYTLDTQFRIDDFSPGALGLISLGLAPTKTAVVHCTASMVFVDVRTGFVYGAAEASADDDQLANSWTDNDAVDQCRRRVERRAFEALLVESQKAWSSIAEQRLRQIAAAADAGPAPLEVPDATPDASPDASNGASAASAP
ncbi:MAG: hypothetical protein LW636_09170 [Planctomycetaceae bacterium]|nr:hypothetical protein [Planctomycetaceae bacterium]